MFEGEKTEIRSWSDASLKPSNAQQSITITRSDLPLHCPVPGTTLWDSHPRVFLPIETSGHAKCPYCGTEFALADEGEASDVLPLSGTRR